MSVRRPGMRWAIALVTLLSLLLGPIRIAAQSTRETGHAQIVAQGVDLMPKVPVAWRVTSATAKPADKAEAFPRTLGFAIGADDPVLVLGETGGATLIQDGQAIFHAEGQRERRASTTSKDADYVTIELIVADAVDTKDSLGTATLVASSEPFTAPRGTRNVQLTRDTLAAAEASHVAPANNAPFYLYVTSGVVQVTAGNGAVSEVAQGEANAFTGEIDLLAGNDETATVLIAAIGDEVELPPTPTQSPTPPSVSTGTVVMHLELCPDGLDATCDPVSNTEVAVPSFHLLTDDNVIIPDRAKLSDNGATLTWSTLATGTYTTGQVEHDTPMDIDGASWNDGDVGWRFRVRANRETELTLKIGANNAQQGTGSIVVTLYDCPAGVDPAVDNAECDLSGDSWDVLVENPGQSGTNTWSLESDAVALGDSQYRFESLPAQDLVFWPDPDCMDGLQNYAVGGDPTFDSGTWLVNIPDGGEATAAVYRLDVGDVPATETPAVDNPGPSGSLVITQLDCPYGTDIDVDASACQLTTQPWNVYVSNDDTGEGYQLLTAGVASDSGTYVLEGLTPGTYSIIVQTNDNWDVIYDATVEVDDVQESYVTVYSVDLRAP